MCVLIAHKVSRVINFDPTLNKFSSLLVPFYCKENHCIALIGSPHLWTSNEFGCEFISNRAELLTCLKVNNSSIAHIIHYRNKKMAYTRKWTLLTVKFILEDLHGCLDHPSSTTKWLSKLLNIHYIWTEISSFRQNEPVDRFGCERSGNCLVLCQSTRRSQYGGCSGWAVTFITVSLSVLAPSICKE